MRFLRLCASSCQPQAGHTIAHDSSAVDRVIVAKPLKQAGPGRAAPSSVIAQANLPAAEATSNGTYSDSFNGCPAMGQNFQPMKASRPATPPSTLARSCIDRDLDELHDRQRGEQALHEHRAEHAFAEHACMAARKYG